MATLGQGSSLIFRIDGDSSGFRREMKAVDASLGNIGSKFSAFANAAALPAAAIASVAAIQARVAAQVVTGLFNLAKSASDAGSEIKDMQDKTGLAAVTLSTLKLAADSAGSSFEQVGGGIAKFAKLLGEAKNGNETAQASLAALGVGTTDLDEALKQVIKSIADAKEGTDQITLAQKAFGKAGADLIPVIKQINGNLAEAEKEAKKLGTTLTESDIKAADEFGDTLGVLSTQVSTLANRFALQFAPQITAALVEVITFLGRNQGVAVVWGNAIGDVLRGVIGVFSYAKNTIGGFLAAIGISFTSSAGQARAWAMAILAAINPVLLIAAQLGRMFGKNTPKESQEGGGFVASASGIPSVSPGGGGKGGGGGASAADTAEQERKKAVQAAMDTMRDKIAIFKSTSAEAIAILDEQLSRNAISEFQHLKETRRAKELEAKNEANLLAQFARNANLNDDERAEAELKRNIARREARIEELKTQTLINKEFNKANKDLVEKIEKQEEFVRLHKEELELLRKQSAANAAERRLKNYQYDQELKQKLDKEASETGFGAGFGSGLGASSIVTNVTDPMTGVTSAVANASNAFTVFGQMAGAAVASVAQGIGSMVQAWVLMGTAGPQAMRKMVASVLAGVAAQSAVLAVFELAKGFAALFFNPAEAAAHFKAAALFGSIAVATGLSGRAVAGDAFSSQAGGGSSGGGSGGDGAGQPERLNFTERFEGFLQRSNDQVTNMLQRTNEVLGGVAESVDTFNQKFGVTTPGAVVMAGAGDAGEAIFGAVTGHLDSDLRATSNLVRVTGKME